MSLNISELNTAFAALQASVTAQATTISALTAETNTFFIMWAACLVCARQPPARRLLRD